MLLLVAIISYILSLVIALVLVIASKRMNPGWFRMAAGLHIVFGAFFLFTHFTYPGGINLSFLLFFCTGIITSGIAFGTRRALYFRIYFGFFSASIVVFLI